LHAALTQAQLAEGRYTKAYVSALENGLVKPSMAALHFFAGRLGLPIEHLLSNREEAWTRLDADLRLASGDWAQAIDAYASLLESSPGDPVRAELLLGLAEGQARLGDGTAAVRAGSEAAALFAARAPGRLPGRRTGRRSASTSWNAATRPSGCSIDCSTRSPRACWSSPTFPFGS
jgi:transcriptional regulator with XRE-family HTH domain